MEGCGEPLPDQSVKVFVSPFEPFLSRFGAGADIGLEVVIVVDGFEDKYSVRLWYPQQSPLPQSWLQQAQTLLCRYKSGVPEQISIIIRMRTRTTFTSVGGNSF